jgi:hypothetical protein
MLQKITSTDFNRYPGIFRTMQAVMRARHGIGLNGSRLRILSFGCSEGHEMQSARCYFPHAFIYGCDVNKQVLRRARKALANDRFAHVFLSEEGGIVENGPYDIIFAMSVFCQYPESKKVDNINALFPFARFQELAGVLCRNLNPGGIFCLMNSSYLFRDLDAGPGFAPLRSPLQGGNGFIDKFARDGSRLTTSFGSKKTYSHRRESSSIHDDDLIDCMYRYAPDGFKDTEPFVLGEEPAGFMPGGAEIRIAGECLQKAIREKRAAMSLVGQPGVDVQGDWWLRNCWQRSTFDGSIMEMEPFWHRVDPDFALKPERLHRQAESLDQYLSSPRTLRERFGGVLRRIGLDG